MRKGQTSTTLPQMTQIRSESKWVKKKTQVRQQSEVSRWFFCSEGLLVSQVHVSLECLIHWILDEQHQSVLIRKMNLFLYYTPNLFFFSLCSIFSQSNIFQACPHSLCFKLWCVWISFFLQLANQTGLRCGLLRQCHADNQDLFFVLREDPGQFWSGGRLV